MTKPFSNLRDAMTPEQRATAKAMVEESLRGTGRTTRQIATAPVGAFYVVNARAEIDYIRHLPAYKTRLDLVFQVAEDFYWNRRWMGSHRQIVFDHFALENAVRNLPPDFLPQAWAHNERVRKWVKSRNP